MSFDLRGYLPENSVLSQLIEGGLNARDNCVPTSFHIAMIALGYPDVPPQVWTDYEYGASYFGPEAMSSAVDFINRHPELFPNPPAISITYASARDVLAVIDNGANIRANILDFAQEFRKQEEADALFAQDLAAAAEKP